MCQNATKTAAALMAAIEPTLKNLIQFAGIDGTTIFNEYDIALAAVQAWKPGTTADQVLQVVNDLLTAFNALPVPDQYKTLANIIVAGIAAVVAVIEANSTSSPTEQAGIVAKAVQDVNTLVPGGFKYHKGIFAVFEASPAKQYHDTWNKAVKNGGFPAGMEV